MLPIGFRHIAIAALFGLAQVGASHAATNATAPIKAVPGPLVSNYAGTMVADPYRALEDVKSPTTQAWAASQTTFARQQLDRLAGLTALRAEIDALDAAQAPRVASVRVTQGGQWFYLKRMPGQNIVKLYVRASAIAKERLLLDPEVWQKRDGTPYAINNFNVSPDGRHLAAVISKADAELGELQVFDVRTGATVGTAVPGIWGELPAVWSRDSQRFAFARGQDALKPDGMAFGKMEIWERNLAGGPDRLLMGFGSGHGPQVRERDWLFVDPTNSAKYTLAGRWEGIGSMARLDIARTDDLQREALNAPWTPVFDEKANIQDFGVAGRWVYARTFTNAPRYQVLRYDLDLPGAPPVTVVPQMAGVIDGMTVAREGLYLVVRTGSVSELWRYRHGAAPAQLERVTLPFVGAVSLFEGDVGVPGVLFSLEGWTHERQIYRTKGTKAVKTSLVPHSGSSVGSDWVAEEATCPSHDGVQVPMSIIYRRGLVKDGSHPTLIDGYGGYGVSEPAYFNRKLDPWLQRSGIFVDVKPRGGGAYGREWYQAGVGPRKANTWKDMIACGQALVARGYTSTATLAIEGTSMGGVAVGRAITERPDLFAAAVVRVGITDTVRFIEATTNGPNHLDEMGSEKTAEGIAQLLTMSTYHHVKDGERYPAVMFTTGMNDNRVAPWISFKTYARMAAATASGRPVLLRVEADGGHGVSTTQAQRNSELADRLAFLLWNMGDKAFQPAPQQ